MVDYAMQSTEKNARDLESAASGVYTATGRAVFGGNASDGAPEGPARRAVNAARQRMNDPAARAERERARRQKADDEKAAREAAAAAARDKREAEAAKKMKEDAAKKVKGINEKMIDKQADINKIVDERASALGGKSNEALKANDVRSSEGMAQFIALATGREDPAIAEYRKQTQKLEEIRAELRALQQEKVDILGAAA